MPAVTMVSRNNDRARGSAGRRRGAMRADRDGDLLMDIASKTRTRVGKNSSSATPSHHSKDLVAKGKKTGILSGSAERAILRQAASGDVSMKENRPSGVRGAVIEIKVTGWEKSKASDNRDGGVSALIKWLEKKATMRLGSKSRDVKIKKYRVEADALIITVLEQDEVGVLRLNGFGWAGTKLQIQRCDGRAPIQGANPKTEETKSMLRGVLERRYNPEIKLLDLSALGQDAQLRAQAIFDTKSTASKVFPAMMKVLELSFDTPQELAAAVESVSLANNELQNLNAVTALGLTLPKLKNLDLSNNNFDHLSALSGWRKRFYFLQHLVISNNPLEQNEPNYAAEIISWYPHLRMLNNIQVRTEEEVASGAKNIPLPFPIRSPHFQDEGGIAETFVRNFFAGMDSDRQALVKFYYDDKSHFTFALNTTALRDPTGAEQTEKNEWSSYIKSSRNLKKITQLPARMSRLLTDVQAISNAYNAMPKTKHPDLSTEAKKWLVEAHIQPGVQDPTGQSPTGVDGFLITVHSEFDELDTSTGQPKKKRSVDHIFVIGPNTSGGVRIHSHQLSIRTHGGSNAFEPEDIEAWQGVADVTNTLTAPDATPQLPSGLTLEMAEQMVVELGKQTSMNLQYSKDCLEQVGWDFPKALEAFNSVKANLPSEAFVQPTV